MQSRLFKLVVAVIVSAVFKTTSLIGSIEIRLNMFWAAPRASGSNLLIFLTTSNLEITEVIERSLKIFRIAADSGSSMINFKIAELSKYQLKIVLPPAFPSAHQLNSNHLPL